MRCTQNYEMGVLSVAILHMKTLSLKEVEPLFRAIELSRYSAEDKDLRSTRGHSSPIKGREEKGQL